MYSQQPAFRIGYRKQLVSYCLLGNDESSRQQKNKVGSEAQEKGGRYGIHALFVILHVATDSVY